MRQSLSQRQEQRVEAQLWGIRLSELLELPERDYRKWTAMIEADPLYRRLARPVDGTARAIRRKRWGNTRLAVDWEGMPAIMPLGADFGAVPEATLAAIQKMGREAFERNFLYDEGAMTLAELAENSGVSVDEARAVMEYVDRTALADASTHSPGLAPRPLSQGREGLPMEGEVVAEYRRGPAGVELRFTDLSYARGRYEIDYERVEALKRSGDIARKDWSALRALLGRLEQANAKQTVLAGLLRLALKVQQRFLDDEKPDSLVALTQKDAAERLEVSTAAVSRALARRSVRLPSAEFLPLAELFPSQRDIGVAFVRAQLRRAPGLKDAELRRLLQKERRITVTLRSVNGWRRAV